MASEKENSDKDKQQSSAMCDKYCNLITQVASNTPIGEKLLYIAANLDSLDPDMSCTITVVDSDFIGESYSPKLPAFFGQVFEGQKIGPDSCTYGKVAYLKQAIIIENITEDPSWKAYDEMAKRSGLKTCIAEPIFSSDGKVIGVLSLYYRKSKVLDPKEKESVYIAVQLASITLEQYNLSKTINQQEISYENLEMEMVQREQEIRQTLDNEKHQLIKSMSHDLRVPLNSIFDFSKMLLIANLDDKQKDVVHEIEKASNRLMEIVDNSVKVTQTWFGDPSEEVNDYFQNEANSPLIDEAAEDHPSISSSANDIAFYHTAEKYGDENHGIRNGKYTSKLRGDVIDCSVLEFTTGFDRKVHSHLMKVFLESTHETMKNLQDAINRDMYSNIEFAAHKLKSAAKSIGAKHFAYTASLIEKEIAEKNKQAIEDLYVKLREEVVGLEKFIDEFSRDSIVENSDSKKPRNIQSLEILVVDDDVFLIEQMRAVLGRMGIRGVSTATSGNQALQTLEFNNKIDIIICDLNMPEMSGVEFFTHLAKLNYPGGLILVSSDDRQLTKAAKEADNSTNIKIMGTLTKPLSPQTLYNILEKNKQHFSKTDKMLVQDVTINELFNAIHSNQLHIYYQPQIEMKTGKVVGAEAVVRWLRPKRGLLPPDLFVYLAEENNLIDALTLEVFEQAMNQAVKWQALGCDLDLALNLSVDSFKRSDLQEWLINVAAKIGFPSNKVLLELKENRLTDSVLSQIELLSELGLAGYRFSIDDFGSGFSNFENLRSIPFKELRIDRTFVNGSLFDEACQAIVESSIALAKIYKMNTVAKGVDTKAQWDLMQKLGCDVVQGYYIAKPMPAEKFSLWLKNWYK